LRVSRRLTGDEASVLPHMKRPGWWEPGREGCEGEGPQLWRAACA